MQTMRGAGPGRGHGRKGGEAACFGGLAQALQGGGEVALEVRVAEGGEASVGAAGLGQALDGGPREVGA